MNRAYEVWGDKILGGPLYARSELPPWWSNGSYLPYRYLHITSTTIPFITPEKLAIGLLKNQVDLALLDPDRFPCIPDFEVIMRAQVNDPRQKESEFKYEVRFFSSSHGYLASLRHYDSSSKYTTEVLSREDFVIPSGNIALPYFDFGQWYAHMILEWNGYVYVLDGAEISTKGYDVWFKVERDRYFSQWEHARQLSQEHEERLRKEKQ